MIVESVLSAGLYHLAFLCCGRRYTNQRQAAQHLVRDHGQTGEQAARTLQTLAAPLQRQASAKMSKQRAGARGPGATSSGTEQ